MTLTSDLFFFFIQVKGLVGRRPFRELKVKIGYIYVHAPVFKMIHQKYFYILKEEKRREDFNI